MNSKNQLNNRKVEKSAYTIADVAEMFSVSQDTVRAMLARGDLEAIRFGKRNVRIPARELETFPPYRRVVA